MLYNYHTKGLLEAGCDEAGRGCLAGPVFAAAVILPEHFKAKELNDSKKLSEKQRYQLREYVEENAMHWAVAQVSPAEIDEINILNASFLAMHLAIDKLAVVPDQLLIDGPRFNSYKKVPHHCIIKGDGKFLSIAAASVLAKTYRDDFMHNAHQKYPMYDWNKNKGYPTLSHKQAIQQFGPCPLHRKSFNYHIQMKIGF